MRQLSVLFCGSPRARGYLGEVYASFPDAATVLFGTLPQIPTVRAISPATEFRIFVL